MKDERNSAGWAALRIHEKLTKNEFFTSRGLSLSSSLKRCASKKRKCLSHFLSSWQRNLLSRLRFYWKHSSEGKNTLMPTFFSKKRQTIRSARSLATTKNGLGRCPGESKDFGNSKGRNKRLRKSSVQRVNENIGCALRIACYWSESSSVASLLFKGWMWPEPSGWTGGRAPLD